MPQLLVRKVDEDLVIRLKQRAARAGRSAEAEHRLILEEALRTGEPSFAERARRHQQTLRKKCLRGEITEGEARVRAQDLVDAPRTDRAADSVAGRDAHGGRLGHSIYDCFYPAAALLRDTTLVTAGRRFAAKAADHPYFACRIGVLGLSRGPRSPP